jgi:hypothetical protein
MSAVVSPIPVAIPIHDMYRRRCGHCADPNHMIDGCERAIRDSKALDRMMMRIRNNRPDVSVTERVFDPIRHENMYRYIERRLHDILQGFTVEKLKLLIRVFGQRFLPRFARQLQEQRILSAQEVRMTYKQDKIKVLMWFYFYSNVTIINTDLYRAINAGYPIPVQGVPQAPTKFAIIGKIAQVETDLTTFECPVCIIDNLSPKEKVSFNCSHPLCKSCFVEFIDHCNPTQVVKCPLCRVKIATVHFNNYQYCEEISQKYFQ